MNIPTNHQAIHEFQTLLQTLVNDEGIIKRCIQIATYNQNLPNALLYENIIRYKFQEVTNSEQKLCLLYIIDGIVKADSTMTYRMLFNKSIHIFFVHTYYNSTEQIKIQLWQLLITWENVFHKQVLQLIKQEITNPQHSFGDITSQQAMISALQIIHGNQQNQMNIPIDMNSNSNAIPIDVSFGNENTNQYQRQ